MGVGVGSGGAGGGCLLWVIVRCINYGSMKKAQEKSWRDVIEGG